MLLSYTYTIFQVPAVVALMFVILLALPCHGRESKQKELAWSQSDGLRHEIYHSSYKDGYWEKFVQITDNNANNLHPVLNVAPDGKKWLFWSAVRPDGISIEYAVAQADTWSEPLKMKLDHRSAITPSILIEDNGTVCLVWAGNNGGRDEIYYSRSAGSSWLDAKIINIINDVPDIKPEVFRNTQGEIEVIWHGFRDGTYKLLTSTYSADSWSPEQEVEEQEEQEEKSEEELLKESGTELPNFMPKDSQYFLKVLEGVPNENSAKIQ